MCEARKKIPINLAPDNDGDIAVNKDQDIIFILTSSLSLMFFNFDETVTGP